MDLRRGAKLEELSKQRERGGTERGTQAARRNEFCSGSEMGLLRFSLQSPAASFGSHPHPKSSLLQATQPQSFQCFSYTLALSFSLWTVSLHWLPFGNLPPRTECSSPVRADSSLPPSSGTYAFINSARDDQIPFGTLLALGQYKQIQRAQGNLPDNMSVPLVSHRRTWGRRPVAC